MTDNKIIQRLFGFCLAVFLLCLVAIVPLLIAEGYSGQDAPYETLEMYDKLESILGWLILSSMLVPAVVWVLIEVRRAIRSRFKVSIERGHSDRPADVAAEVARSGIEIAATDEEQAAFARKHPGDLVITLPPPPQPPRKRSRRKPADKP